jgi:hypothetical protein
MSTGLVDRRAPATTGRPTRAARRAGRGEQVAWPSLFETPGGEPTLDEVLSGVWEGLTAHQVVDCPVCGATMEPKYGAHALPIGGACGGCGAKLS